eukprot:TRINITY_DN926_c0_g1_i1.p1 TRINITY_DN926_c0_g1~~TRINITY_DN926_c0_g1_i1.p1  ORF type:complete len:175 (-),score=30.83 TRINITY_DN926_c0_g1_i1:22-546(-)
MEVDVELELLKKQLVFETLDEDGVKRLRDRGVTMVMMQQPVTDTTSKNASTSTSAGTSASVGTSAGTSTSASTSASTSTSTDTCTVTSTGSHSDTAPSRDPKFHYVEVFEQVHSLREAKLAIAARERPERLSECGADSRDAKEPTCVAVPVQEHHVSRAIATLRSKTSKKTSER